MNPQQKKVISEMMKMYEDNPEQFALAIYNHLRLAKKFWYIYIPLAFFLGKYAAKK